jgi:hypothetical protein
MNSKLSCKDDLNNDDIWNLRQKILHLAVFVEVELSYDGAVPDVLDIVLVHAYDHNRTKNDKSPHVLFGLFPLLIHC